MTDLALSEPGVTLAIAGEPPCAALETDDAAFVRVVADDGADVDWLGRAR